MKQNLAEKIKELNKSYEYDCLLMFSGGKDSSYLLYYLSEVLGLRVATVTITHNFIAKETLENIESFTKKYSAKHISVENQSLNQSGKHFLESWINRPDEASLITLCTGCRLAMIKPIIKVAKEENINSVIWGIVPYEATDYRVKLVNYPKGMDGKIYFFLGYLRLIIRNPSLVGNWKAFKCQIEEFYYNSNHKKIFKQNGLNLIRPFYDYLEYDEKMIVETLKKLNWKKDSLSGNSYWRADCKMNGIRQFFHNWISGYNENEKYYGKMLNDKLITKDYYVKNIQNSYNKEDVLKVLKSLNLSEGAIVKYEKYLTKKQ